MVCDSTYHNSGLPCQVNNKDCGVFVLKYLKCCLLGEDIMFKVESTLLREEVKTDLLQWKQVLEVMEVEDSDCSSSIEMENLDNDKITGEITENQYQEMLHLTDGIITCSGDCIGHLNRHVMFVADYNKNYCGRTTHVRHGYGNEYVSDKVHEQIKERMMKEHLVKKKMSKSIFETSTNMLCTTSKKVYMKREALNSPMFFATRFVDDVLVKECIAYLLKVKLNISLKEADDLCRQTDKLKTEI
ncbi:uncharacterized protein LOC144353387 [Saccoglossus kowalevskii]